MMLSLFKASQPIENGRVQTTSILNQTITRKRKRKKKRNKNRKTSHNSPLSHSPFLISYCFQLFKWRPFSPLHLFVHCSIPNLQDLHFLPNTDQIFSLYQNPFLAASEKSIPCLKDNLFLYPKLGFPMSIKA